MTSAPDDDVHILLGTPCGQGGLTRQYLHSVLALKDRCSERGWGLTVKTLPDALVTRSRNSMASECVVNPTYTHLLMADADIGFAPEVIERLVASNHDVVGACVPLRQVKWDRVRAALDTIPGLTPEQLQSISHRAAVTFLSEEKQRLSNGFLPVRYLGGALLMATRDALERMVASVEVERYATGGHEINGEGGGWTFFDPLIDEDGVYLSEDYAFCMRWRNLGGEVWADMLSPVTHTGEVTVHADASMTLATARALIAARKTI